MDFVLLLADEADAARIVRYLQAGVYREVDVRSCRTAIDERRNTEHDERVRWIDGASHTPHEAQLRKKRADPGEN